MQQANGPTLTMAVFDEAPKPDWYTALCDEIDAIRVETHYIATEALLKGKLAIGEALAKQSQHASITELVQCVGKSIKVSERELWYCYKFHAEYKKLEAANALTSKALSWNKVKKMLADPAKAKQQCVHKHTTTLVLCVDCGGKVNK